MVKRSGFTLIELLIVIAIIAILSVVVILALNPTEMQRRGRDAGRLSDMDTLVHALNLYQQDQATLGKSGFLGAATVLYVSLPDPSLSSNQTSTCTSLGLPTPPAGYTYQCAAPQSYRANNGNGWLPINFAGMSIGAPLGQLPTDPVNVSSTGLYYTYTTNGSQYELTSLFESTLYKNQYAQNYPIPDYPEVYAKGSNLALSPLFNSNGLVGYWNFDEGSGTTAYDSSGLGSNGTLTCIPSCGTPPAWSSGKIGGALSFSGTENAGGPGAAVAIPSNIPALSTISWSAWFNNSAASTDFILENSTTHANAIRFAPGPLFDNVSLPGGTFTNTGNATPSTGSWNFVVGEFDGSNLSIYLNGVLDNTVSTSSQSMTWAGNSIINIGVGFTGTVWPFNGLIDDVRIYNRALSPAEIFALYSAEK